MTPEPTPSPRWVATPVLALAWLAVACGGSTSTEPPVCGQETPVGVGITIDYEALQQGDRRFADAYIDYYSLNLPTARELNVAMTSSEFDPLLLVFLEQGDVLQAFDSMGVDPGLPETASLTDSLPAGCHLIGASSWQVDTTGSYILTVDEPQ